MLAKRAQGRPCRGGAEVGRGKIVEGLRDLLRSRRNLEVSRKDLAEHASVTPALISYYFPNKDLLLREAVEPIISRYADRLETVISGEDNPDLKIKKLIGIFLEMYRKDAHLFEIYQRLAEKRQLVSVRDEMKRMQSSLSTFISKWRGSKGNQSLHAAVFQGAIWGICNFVSRVEAEAPDGLHGDREDPEDELFRVLTSGCYERVPTSGVESIS